MDTPLSRQPMPGSTPEFLPHSYSCYAPLLATEDPLSLQELIQFNSLDLFINSLMDTIASISH